MNDLKPYDQALLEKRIKHKFSDRGLLTEALTHSSYSNEHGGTKKHRCNERLEFLGDSVLSLVTSEHIFSLFPDSPEGELTRMRAELVREETLAEFAVQIGLGNYLLLGNGEEKGGGRSRNSILADAFEALLAAVYLDAGADVAGKNAVRAYLIELTDEKIEVLREVWHGADCKTRLQQIVQRSEGENLEYITVDEQGPDHDKTFTVEARLNSNVIGVGTGRSKRAAEQNAAKQALELFGE